ncbi:MAG: hypothetical protein LBH91_00305 [Prevotellaceae bacterium]|jgi:hypothetical protein|nr:hypothetical protein [Prevotellaceae bacterium]
MGKDKNKKVIDKPHLILCEGEDTTQFMIRFLEYLRKRETGFESFMAFDFGGIKELPIFLSEDLPRKPGYDIAVSMTIVRDAEENHSSAVQSIKSALANSGLPAPSEPNTIVQGDTMKVAFSLFPSLSKDDNSGTLEDLYISNLKEDGVEHLLNDINFFLDALKSKGRNFTWLHKTKLHTYFSVTDFVSKTIGQATEAGAFNYECNEMNQLKELLRSIALI